MAHYTYNGTNLDTVAYYTNVSNSTATLVVAGVTSNTFTAPNTTDSVTGVWIFFHSVPSIGDVTISLQESGVTKTTEVLPLASIDYGWTYVRFTTPYKFTTTSAGAYRFFASNPYNSGGLRIDGSKFAYGVTTDATIALSSLAVGDDLWVGGFMDSSGLTAKSLTLTDGLSFGSGDEKVFNYQTSITKGAAITVGNGGTCKLDNSTNTTVQIRGAVFVTKGGLFDMRGSPTKSIITKLIIDCETANGNYGLFSASAAYGGQFLTTGATVPYSFVYSSGTGTTANPVISASAHGLAVGDELIFGGATDYLKNEKKFVKSIPASNQLVLSDTSGGAESALTQTHAAGSVVGNLTRNSVISSLTNTRGFWIMNEYSGSTPVSDFSYTRLEYPNISSGYASQISPQGNPATCSGSVWYNSAASGRSSLSIGDTATNTYTGIIMYNQAGTNYSGQSGIQVANGANKTFVDCLAFNAPSETTMTGLFSFYNSTNCIVKTSHSYGCNANNSSLGYAIGLFGSSGIVVNDSSFDANRRFAVNAFNSQDVQFNRCNFGTIATNTTDIYLYDSTRNSLLFNKCSFGSATLIDNYKNTLDGSDYAFQEMDGNESKHRWYTNAGSFWSSGVGLSDTTIRTAGSLALAIKPENINGAEMLFKIPAPPTSRVGVFGYIYRNATFSSGDITVELFLPGTLLTDTPDDTYTLPTTTGSWLYWSLDGYYSGTAPRYAQVRITAKTATAGAYAFLDDLYDASTNNKVAGLDLWDAGHTSPIMVVTDFSSSIPSIVNAVWSDNDTYGTGEKGYKVDLIDTAVRLIKGLFGK